MLQCPWDQLSSSNEQTPGVQESPDIFYTRCILGKCEHLFRSEPSCQIFLSLWCMVDFPDNKIFPVCLQWPKHREIFLSFPPQNLFHRQGELVFTTNFLLCKGVCFHSYFQPVAAVPIAMEKWISFSAWPLGNPYLKLFSRVNIPELLLPLPTKNLLWSQMCRCFSFNINFEDHSLLHFLGFHLSWTPYSASYSDQAPTGALGCGWWEGEQLQTFSCSVYAVLGTLAYQHSNHKANTKGYHLWFSWNFLPFQGFLKR